MPAEDAVERSTDRTSGTCGSRGQRPCLIDINAIGEAFEVATGAGGRSTAAMAEGMAMLEVVAAGVNHTSSLLLATSEAERTHSPETLAPPWLRC